MTTIELWSEREQRYMTTDEIVARALHYSPDLEAKPTVLSDYARNLFMCRDLSVLHVREVLKRKREKA